MLIPALTFSSSTLGARPREVRIAMHSGTELEQRGKEQLERILSAYHLEKWLFTDEVVIQSRVLLHSHPVLTLNTRYLDDDVTQLATFVQEQLHWFLTDAVSEQSVHAAIAELETTYASVPSKPPEGARGSESTYLHLIVCHLELQALIELLGETRAREYLAGVDHYTWVYKTVLEDTEAIHTILTRHGIEVPEG
jgi:hypothetical protein